MGILGVRDFWKDVSAHTGFESKEIRSQLNDLINRRNLIAHRADRPEEGTPAGESDPHGLRPITHAWTSTRITTAKAFVQSASEAVQKAIGQLELIIAQKEEQKLARQTLAKPAAVAPALKGTSFEAPEALGLETATGKTEEPAKVEATTTPSPV